MQIPSFTQSKFYNQLWAGGAIISDQSKHDALLSKTTARGPSPPLPDLIEIVFVGWGVCRLAGELMGGGAGNT